MKKSIVFLAALVVLSAAVSAQTTINPGYFLKIPVAFKNCGALYTYDSIALTKKKYIFIADFQNQAMLFIGGKQVKLLLTDAKNEAKTAVTSFKGGGYLVVLRSITTSESADHDLESGTLTITKGNRTRTIKIHGESGCDVATQEGNSN